MGSDGIVSRGLFKESLQQPPVLREPLLCGPGVVVRGEEERSPLKNGSFVPNGFGDSVVPIRT